MGQHNNTLKGGRMFPRIAQRHLIPGKERGRSLLDCIIPYDQTWHFMGQHNNTSKGGRVLPHTTQRHYEPSKERRRSLGGYIMPMREGWTSRYEAAGAGGAQIH